MLVKVELIFSLKNFRTYWDLFLVPTAVTQPVQNVDKLTCLPNFPSPMHYQTTFPFHHFRLHWISKTGSKDVVCLPIVVKVRENHGLDLEQIFTSYESTLSHFLLCQTFNIEKFSYFGNGSLHPQKVMSDGNERGCMLKNCNIRTEWTVTDFQIQSIKSRQLKHLLFLFRHFPTT